MVMTEVLPLEINRLKLKHIGTKTTTSIILFAKSTLAVYCKYWALFNISVVAGKRVSI